MDTHNLCTLLAQAGPEPIRQSPSGGLGSAVRSSVGNCDPTQFGESTARAVLFLKPTAAAERQLHTQPLLAALIWVLEGEVDAQLLTRGARRMELIPEECYLKLGFGGVHADSNQRLMYTSA